MNNEELSRVAEVLSDPQLSTLLRNLLADETDVFRGIDQEELTPDICESIQDILTILRYLNSKTALCHEGYTIAKQETLWLFMSYRMHALIRSITAKSSKASNNTIQLIQYLKTGLPLQPLIEDIVCALRRDGFDMSYEEVRGCITGEANATSSGISSAIQDVYEAAISAFVGCEFGLLNLDGFYSNLLRHSVSPNSIPPKRASAYLPSIIKAWQNYYEPTTIVATIEKQLQHSKDINIPLIIPVLGICDLILEFRPFGQLSALMEIVVRSALFQTINLPGILGVPLSKMSEEWEKDRTPKEQLVVSLGQGHKKNEFGVDVSGYFMQKLTFCDTGLDELSRLLDRAEDHTETLLSMIRSDYRLNLRQQQALIFLVGNRKGSYDSSSYRQAFDTTAVTSRSDLEKLEKLGFLQRDVVNRKSIYRLRPDFENALFRNNAT